MHVSYNGLWKILIDKGLQKQDLVNKAGLSSATVAKMGKGEPVSNKVLEKLAKFLECNISEIMSYEYSTTEESELWDTLFGRIVL